MRGILVSMTTSKGTTWARFLALSVLAPAMIFLWGLWVAAVIFQPAPPAKHHNQPCVLTATTGWVCQ